MTEATLVLIGCLPGLIAAGLWVLSDGGRRLLLAPLVLGLLLLAILMAVSPLTSAGPSGDESEDLPSYFAGAVVFSVLLVGAYAVLAIGALVAAVRLRHWPRLLSAALTLFGSVWLGVIYLLLFGLLWSLFGICVPPGFVDSGGGCDLPPY